jgi:hypothetical protein
MDVSGFIAKWRRAELKERSGAQEHFLDLRDLVGHPRPAAADPKGEWFTFEKGAVRRGGDAGAPDESVSQGWCDVWKRAFFAIEYKGKHGVTTNSPHPGPSPGAPGVRSEGFPASAGPPARAEALSPETPSACGGPAFGGEGVTTNSPDPEPSAAKRPVGPGDVGVARYPRLVPRDAESAKALVTRTLTALYNQRPSWLELAHRHLDEAVYAAYGRPVDLADQQILERLPALNQARTTGGKP